MGADFFLYKDEEEQYQIYYWRNSYAIDFWIDKHCGKEWDEDGDPSLSPISREKLIQLVEDCRKFLSSVGGAWKDKEFAGTGYSITEEFERDYIMETITGLEKILEDYPGEVFFYKET